MGKHSVFVLDQGLVEVEEESCKELLVKDGKNLVQIGADREYLIASQSWQTEDR